MFRVKCGQRGKGGRWGRSFEKKNGLGVERGERNCEGGERNFEGGERKRRERGGKEKCCEGMQESSGRGRGKWKEDGGMWEEGEREEGGKLKGSGNGVLGSEE